MGFFRVVGGLGAEVWDYSGIDLALVELIGKGYVVDHCIALYNRIQKEDAFREMLISSINQLNLNFAERFGGRVTRYGYLDLFKKVIEPEKSGDEIAAEIIKKAGLKFKE